MSIYHYLSPTGCTRRLGAALLTALMLVGGCASPTAPSADLRGNWDFSFSAFDQNACTAGGGLTRGCAGSGSLEFSATRPQVVASHAYRASCQSCEGAADFGVGNQPLATARVTGDVLEFTLAACRFTATIPPANAQTIDGAVACRPVQAAAPEVNGRWTMSRR